MSGPPRVRSTNVSFGTRKPTSKPLRKVERKLEEDAKAVSLSPPAPSSPRPRSVNAASVLRRQELLLRSDLSLNASCSSDASTDSFHSRASTGRISRSFSAAGRGKHYSSWPRIVASGQVSESPADGSQYKRRCAWVTPTTDPSYAAFHDEEWGVPVHDDKKLFELLVLSGALSELTWPAILSRRHVFRKVFADFDPVTVSKFNEKKLLAAGSAAGCLLSEPKLRAVIENARQISKVIDEFGSFDKYIWSFVNYKAVIGKYRYSRQVPVKTPKADVISKDLVRRGFRSVGPTVVYSFMQVAGITNDHLIGCFRFKECISAGEEREDLGIKDDADDKKNGHSVDSDLSRAIDVLSLA